MNLTVAFNSLFMQQNSNPTPQPEPKTTVIDEWAVSVKPNADPTIIKKHIEKMVEVSFLSALSSPLRTNCGYLLLSSTEWLWIKQKYKYV